MPLSALVTPFPWAKYSKKLAAKIDQPRCVGTFEASESAQRGMRLAVGMSGDYSDGNAIRLYWIVDLEDGVIVDARFQVFGQSVLIGAAEVICELCIGKNYDQAKRLTHEIVDKQVRDRPDSPAFPSETFPHVALALEAVRQAAEQCTDIPMAANYAAPPVPLNMGEVREGGYPGWVELSIPQKLQVIEQVLNEDIRPYIALDAGGVEVLNLINNTDLVIAYQGTCTSCYSAIGTTLSYIQQVLRNRVHPDIVVVPDIDMTQFGH